MPCNSLRSAVLVGLLMGAAASPSFAASLLNEGSQQAASPLSTYGMQVEAARALRGVMPQGWEFSLEPGAALSGKVSWAPADTWVAVTERIAARSETDILLNWDTHKVVVRAAAPRVVSAAPAATVVTPINNQPAAAPAEVLAEVHPTVKRLPESVRSKPAEAAPSAGPARAFNRTSLKAPLQALADSVGLTLIYEAGDVNLPGPVTLMLSGKLDEDIELLTRALGPSLPLEIIEYRKEKELIVIDATGRRASFMSLDQRPVVKPSFFARLFRKTDPIAIPQDKAGEAPVAVAAVSTPASEPTAPVEQPPVAPVAPVAAAASVVAAAVPPVAAVASEQSVAVAPTAEPALAPIEPPMLVLELGQGERLSVAIERLLKTQGWTLAWRVGSDLEAAAAVRVEGRSIAEILEKVLPQQGLAADLYTPSRTAVIRISQASASVGAQ